jgi:predicted RecA/RadA family phage recombinase
MKNFLQNGDYIDVAAPSGGVDSGDVVIIGNLIGVAVTDAEEDAPVSIAMTGVFALPKDTDTFDAGDYVYYDGSECVDDDEETLIGVCVEDVAAGPKTVKVRLMVGAAGPQGETGAPGSP